jgi:cellulose synthase/poly-beta-1,6-N-acetylglucosamine synthase-like glycosyltransferase
MNLLVWLFFLLFISYAVFTLVLSLAWYSIRSFSTQSEKLFKDNQLIISVLIPIRNEADNILFLLNDLKTQSLDNQLFEIIVIDDHSDDLTCSIIENFINHNTLNIKLLKLDDSKQGGKKSALAQGIASSSGELLVTTDGDCRVQTDWLALIAHFYTKFRPKLISLAVTFTNERNFFEQMQTVEFASLVASGAATLQLGFPTMCNGANLAYQKSAFYAVDGFAGSQQIASGDDEFLMHKIAQKFPQEIYFLKNPQTIVHTQAQKNWTNFYNQRKRWGSKWPHYQDIKIKLLAMYIFLINFSVLLSVILGLSGFLDLKLVLLGVGLKIIPEWLFLGSFLQYLNKIKFILLIPLVQIIYPFYVVLFGLASQSKQYFWKGRKVS